MILVTGATGESGAAVIGEFVRRQLPVRALVRDHARVGGDVPANVEVVEGDMADSETLGDALAGVQKVLLISTADPDLVRTQSSFIDSAVNAGVRHIVKFSGMGCWNDAEFRFARMHAEVEEYLEKSGAAWTHLRPSTFMSDYFREAHAISAEGVLALPMGDARIAPVDTEDIAKVAVSLLHSGGHEGKRYEMTGPEALTVDQVAATISLAAGKSVRYVDIDPAEKTRAMLDAGVPAYFADAMEELFSQRRRGADESRVNLSTHRKFGVRPTTFAEFARRNASVFRGEKTASNPSKFGWRS
ncbi:SDR family oxidoreductase [Actinomadura napierensis]|uniref:SDR family oxidoreductase n=1 Tax=Actinomadura napierensis TaxID=267854 RepID=A0ABN3A2S7_9ACTN